MLHSSTSYSTCLLSKFHIHRPFRLAVKEILKLLKAKLNVLLDIFSSNSIGFTNLRMFAKSVCGNQAFKNKSDGQEFQDLFQPSSKE